MTIPAPGFRLVSGKSPPSAGKWWVQFRNGQIDHIAPWPTKGPRWVHDGSEWDVVAVKPEHEKRKDGRQVDGSYE